MSTEPSSESVKGGRVRSRRILSAVLLLLVATVGLSVWYYQSRTYHFGVTQEGVLYRSGLLTPERLERVIREYGIKTVVNLKSVSENQGAWHAAEIAATRRAGALHLDIAMPPEVPPTESQIRTWIALFKNPKRVPVIVHCHHGVIRTGMLVAVYEIQFQGKSNEQALRDMQSFGHDLQSPQHKAMREFIAHYKARPVK